MDEVRISKFVSRVLRHEPQALGVTLDSEGWTDFARFASLMQAKFGISEPQLVRLVDTNPKRRFVIRGGRIRANQGHTVAVDLGLLPSTPPAVLFHGTTRRAYDTIRIEGLKKIERNHVHLSPDLVMAEKVAARRPGPWVILSVASAAMAENGSDFFQSENGVWLTDAVSPKFLKVEREWGNK